MQQYSAFLTCCYKLYSLNITHHQALASSMFAGAVKRVGRCDAYATEFDLEAEEYVPLPKVSEFFFLPVLMQPFVHCMLGLLAHL